MLSILKGHSPSRASEEELLQRAMGHLYLNRKARELIRKRLGRRDITRMSDAEIFEVVADVINEIQSER